MRAHARILQAELLVLGALVLLAAVPARAVDLAGKTSATLDWSPASGPVAGYQVFVQRNGARPSLPEQTVTTTRATVAGAIGDAIVVFVRGFDAAGNPGPASADSEVLRFTQAPGAPATPAVSPTSLSVTAPLGGSPAAAGLDLRNAGTGTLSWRVDSGASWLAPSPSSGTTTTETDRITLSFSTAALATGTYTTTIVVTNLQTGAKQSVPVSVVILPANPSLAIDQSRIEVSTIAGQPSPTARLAVRNGGGGAMAWLVTDSATWLSSSPSSGASSGEWDFVTLTFHSVDLAPGTYVATLAASAVGATPSIVSIPVTLRVLAPAASLRVSSTGISAHTPFGHAAPAQTVGFAIEGGSTATWSAQTTASWLVASPSTGSAGAGEETLTLRFASEGLAPGLHTALLRLSSPGLESREVGVSLRVRPPAGDVDGDGRSELFLWSRTMGTLLVLGGVMSNEVSAALVTSGTPQQWRLALDGDYDGDGAIDYLWRERVSGTVVICSSQGLAIQACSAPISMPEPKTLLGAADLDGDGRSDVVFRDPQSGTVEACFMRGLDPAPCAAIASHPPSWRVAVGGDSDRDGRAELVAQPPFGSKLAVCEIGGAEAGTCASPPALIGAEIVAAADYDGDADPDALLLSRATSTLLVQLWSGSGSTALYSLGPVPTGAEIAGSADVDGDGRADVVIRNPATGSVDVLSIGAQGLEARRNLGPLGSDFVLGGTSPP